MSVREIVIGLPSGDADILVEALVDSASRTQLGEDQIRCFGMVIDKIRYAQCRLPPAEGMRFETDPASQFVKDCEAQKGD